MEKISYLYGLKGLCAIVVLLNHASNCIEMPNFPIVNDLYCGILAVHIFIIISSYICYKSLICGKNCQLVAIKRYFRLTFPISFALIFVAMMSMVGCFDYSMYSINIPDWFYLEEHNMKSLPYAMLFSVFGTTFGWLNVLWMMKYIFFGTFVCIAMYYVIKGIQIQNKILILFLSLFIFRFYDYMYCGIFIGMIIAELQQSSAVVDCKHGKKKNYIIGVCLLFYISVSVLLFLSPRLAERKQELCLYESIPLIILFFTSYNIQKVLRSKIALFLGNISFAVFLFHNPILSSLGLCMKNSGYCDSIVVFCVIGITIIISYVFNRFIEPICDSWSNKIATKLIN